MSMDGDVVDGSQEAVSIFLNSLERPGCHIHGEYMEMTGSILILKFTSFNGERDLKKRLIGIY
jgi:hypothetical protein